MKAQTTKNRKLNIKVGTMPESARSTKHSEKDDRIRDTYLNRVTGGKKFSLKEIRYIFIK